VAALLERLTAEPQLAGLFLDFDGVLSPIVQRPDDACVPERTRDELERLVSRYALVAVVSGRAGEDVRTRVGVPGVTIVGTHGLELDSSADEWRGRIADFADAAGWPDTERKGLAVTFHYRRADDVEAAVAAVEAIAARARAAGLLARPGRKMLEVLPPVQANKGTAVTELLARAGLRRALVAGDDTTDIDAFRALDGLDLAVRVAIAAEESPPGLREAADVVVATPEDFLALLETL
jgi:trehalose 6-phosphate phosphatase